MRTARLGGSARAESVVSDTKIAKKPGIQKRRRLIMVVGPPVEILGGSSTVNRSTPRMLTVANPT
jgi:hypothetical protein